MTDFLDEYDPFSTPGAAPSRADTFAFANSAQFVELTGVDRATAIRHLRGASQRGQTWAEAVDSFFRNGAWPATGTAARTGPVGGGPRGQTAIDADAELARAIEAADMASNGRDSSVDKMVYSLKQMGFETRLALAAATCCPTLEAATEYCIAGVPTDAAPPVIRHSQPQIAERVPTPRGPGLAVGVPVRAESGGASSSALALSIAMRVSFRGSLHKLSRDGGLFGLRWQKRNFLLDGCALSYSHAENHHSRQGKGNYQVWGVYGLRVSARDSVVQRKEVTGREHVFGLYTGGEQENGAKREQLVLLSADTHEDVDNWLRMIYLAAGRPGVLLRVGDDADATTYKVLCVVDPDRTGRELTAGADSSGRVLVQRVSGEIERLGLRVDDEITTMDGAPVPAEDAVAFAHRLRTRPRPFQLMVRRRRPGAGARPTRPVAATTSVRPEQAHVEVMDLLDLEDMIEFASPSAGEDDDSTVASTHSGYVPETAPAYVPEMVPTAAVDAAAVVAIVRAAFDAGCAAHAASSRGDYDAAEAGFKETLRLLLEVQPLYSADTNAQLAVEAALPGVKLAELYDAARAGMRQQRPQEQPPLPLGGRPEEGRPATAKFAFEATETWQLSVSANEPLTLIEDHGDGWTDVVNAQSKRGLVPSSYLTG